MKIVEEKLNNGNTIQYHQLDNGTCYHVNTPVGVVEELERARLSRKRIRVFYGDPVTGRCWMDEFDTMGTVGRSCGRIKIPLLVKNIRFLGGGAVLTDKIVRIMEGRWILYSHPNFNMPEMRVVESHVPGHPHGVDFDNSRQANFTTKAQAERYMAFMKGERDSK